MCNCFSKEHPGTSEPCISWCAERGALLPAIVWCWNSAMCSLAEAQAALCLGKCCGRVL
jgi:hypothetical protein